MQTRGFVYLPSGMVVSMEVLVSEVQLLSPLVAICGTCQCIHAFVKRKS